MILNSSNMLYNFELDIVLPGRSRVLTLTGPTFLMSADSQVFHPHKVANINYFKSFRKEERRKV